MVFMTTAVKFAVKSPLKLKYIGSRAMYLCRRGQTPRPHTDFYAGSGRRFCRHRLARSHKSKVTTRVNMKNPDTPMTTSSTAAGSNE